MEKYTEQQKAVFQQFYEQCKKANIDPCGGETSRRKAVLLATDNKALKKILGKNPTEDDVVAAYRAGAEKLRQKENAQRSDEAAQRTAQLRKRDAAYADMERQIAQNHGRDKRIFFLEKKISDLDERMRSARGQALSVAQLSVGLSSSMQQKESSWGTLGGIAAGITGSTAVGAAVAAETMAKNAQIRQENAKIEQQAKEMFSPLMGRALDNEAVLSALKRKAEAMRDSLKLLLVDEPKIEKLMEQVSINKPQCCFTEGGTMIVRADVSVKGGLKVADSTNAVLDGYFVAEIFDGNQVVSKAYLNIPRDGIASGSTATLYGHALSVPEGGNYTVLVAPVDLWVSEEYHFRKLTELNGREQIVETVYDLPELCGYHFENALWSPLKISAKTWQQQKKEKEYQEEKKRVASKKRNIILAFCTTAVLAIVAVALLITKVVIPSGQYSDAVSLMNAAQYEQAIAAFEELDGFKDSAEQIEICRMAIKDAVYDEAVVLKDRGDTIAATSTLQKIAGYNKADKLQRSLMQNTIAIGRYLNDDIAIGLRSDGWPCTVGIDYDNYEEIRNCENLISVAVGDDYILGLRDDGTVCTAVQYDRYTFDYGQYNVGDWTDIVAIDAQHWHSVGLKSDGTVVAIGYDEDGECDVDDWTDIVAISAGTFHTLGLRSDGTVVAVGKTQFGRCDVDDWTNIVAIAAGDNHSIGLKSDGTVVATGYGSYGECDINDWTNIVAIATGDHYTLGLKSDGTVIAAGENNLGRCDVDDWNSIVAIAAGGRCTMGLKADGTVEIAGYEHESIYGKEFKEFKDIRLPF